MNSAGLFGGGGGEGRGGAFSPLHSLGFDFFSMRL